MAPGHFMYFRLLDTVHKHARTGLIRAGWTCKEGSPELRPPGLDLSISCCAPCSPRKKSLLVNNIFVVAAAVLFGFSCRAGSFEMIMLGRLLMGVTAGMAGGPHPGSLFLIIHLFPSFIHLFSLVMFFIHAHLFLQND